MCTCSEFPLSSPTRSQEPPEKRAGRVSPERGSEVLEVRVALVQASVEAAGPALQDGGSVCARADLARRVKGQEALVQELPEEGDPKAAVLTEAVAVQKEIPQVQQMSTFPLHR